MTVNPWYLLNVVYSSEGLNCASTEIELEILEDLDTRCNCKITVLEEPQFVIYYDIPKSQIIEEE